MSARPNRTELTEAWTTLRNHGVESIGDFSTAAIGDIVRGSPPYDRKRYSDAEIRLAELVLVLRARRPDLSTHDRLETAPTGPPPPEAA